MIFDRMALRLLITQIFCGSEQGLAISPAEIEA